METNRAKFCKATTLTAGLFLIATGIAWILGAPANNQKSQTNNKPFVVEDSLKTKSHDNSK